MARRRPKQIDNSWEDLGSEDDMQESQDTRASSTPSNRLRTSRIISSRISPNARAVKRPGSRVSSPSGSGFIFPTLEREVPSPKPRRRKPEMEPESIPIKKKKPKPEEISWSDGAQHVLFETLAWFAEIILGGLQFIKFPLKIIFGLYMLFGLAIITTNALTSRVSSALTPVCRIPGSSYILPSLCSSPVKFPFDDDDTATSATKPEPEFDHLMQIQQQFTDLLHQSVDYYAVPAFMKHSQSAMRDVREVVRYSPLKSKNELMLEFDTFVNAASQASWDLESFNSHIGRTVDRIMLTARWTKQILDQIAEPNITRGIVGKAVDLLTYPFQPVKYTEDTVLDLYIKHSDEVQSEIADLLTEAQAVFSLLKSLEDTIDAIQSITARDNHYANIEREEVLAELWSRLGGNRKQKALFNSQLKVLKQISTYGKAAYTNVGGAILKLQTMSAEIEQLKDRLGSVDINTGSSKQKVPLSVHLENIQLGVERLEEARGFARDARLEKSRAVISAGRERFGDDVHGQDLPPVKKEIPAS